MNETHGTKDGRRPELSDEEEEIIVDAVKVFADWGFPFTSTDLRRLVKDYLDGKGVSSSRFADNLPTRRFVDRFIGRHPELAIRKTNNIKRSRAAMSSEEVADFINNWEKTIEGVEPSNIFNFDETNLRDDTGVSKCLFRKGTKYCEKVMNTTKLSISVMFAGSAGGTMLPPMVVYRSKDLYPAWCQRGPKGTLYSNTPSGWFDAFQFRKWLVGILPYLKRLPGRKVLLGDNLASHFSLEVLRICKDNDISFCCLPPNSTDKLQPLDVGIFGPLKKYWRTVLVEHKTKNPGEASLNKKSFPSLLTQVLELANLGRHLPAAFQKCGLVPVSLEKATARVPSRDMPTETEGIRRLMESAIGKRIEELRGVDKDSRAKKKPRGKKIQVPAGQCYTQLVEDDEEEEQEDQEEGAEDEELGDFGENADEILGNMQEVEEEEDVLMPVASRKKRTRILSSEDEDVLEEDEDEVDKVAKKPARLQNPRYVVGHKTCRYRYLREIGKKSSEKYQYLGIPVPRYFYSF